MKEIILSKSEQETLIDWTEDSHEAEIQTFSPGLKRKLAEFAAKCPELCQLIRKGGDIGRGGAVYRIDRRRMCITFKAPGVGWTDEQREAKRQLMNKINAEKLSRKLSVKTRANIRGRC